MRIYLSGAGGADLGTLGLLALDLGHEVLGSDVADSEFSQALKTAGGELAINGQDSQYLERVHTEKPIDWLIFTPALPDNHPELAFAKKHTIKSSKTNDFINQVLKDKKLKLIACCGTHGKTTTTAMMIWLFHQFKIPVSYTLGSQIPWGPGGQYINGAEYFIREADEYDRKFLDFTPYISIVASVDYDHPDTYPTPQDYKDAFIDFIANSHCAYLWREDAQYLDLQQALPNCAHIFGAEEKINEFKLIGEHNRFNAFLVSRAFRELFPKLPHKEIVEKLSNFPGTRRRFEKLAENIYSDYAHHPEEIRATIQMAKEVSRRVVVVYQPHQNIRQKQIMKDNGYGDSFNQADSVYWLPTYLTREDPELAIISPKKLVKTVQHKKRVEIIDDLEKLEHNIRQVSQDALVVIMGAGDIDAWARQKFA